MEGKAAIVLAESRCATTSCGVSWTHLTTASPLTRSFLIFHVHFTMIRILHVLNAFYPEEVEDFTGWGHGFSEVAFEQVCREFGVTVEQMKQLNRPPDAGSFDCFIRLEKKHLWFRG